MLRKRETWIAFVKVSLGRLYKFLFRNFRILSHIFNPRLGEGRFLKEPIIQDFRVGDF